MATITFGFFAVLIAREMPGRTRVWPYLVSGIVVSLIGFSRLYLGAHWLSDVIGGMLFGTFWLLVLGIAYRRRFNRSFWVKPVAWLFYGVFAVAAMVRTAQHPGEAGTLRADPAGPQVWTRRPGGSTTGPRCRRAATVRRRPALAAGRAGGRSVGTAAGATGSARLEATGAGRLAAGAADAGQEHRRR